MTQTISLSKKEHKQGLEIHLELEALKLCQGNVSFEHALSIATGHYNWWANIMNKYELAPSMDLRFDKFSGCVRQYSESESSSFQQTCGFNINKGGDISVNDAETTSTSTDC